MKLCVRGPFRRAGNWVVVVSEGSGPFAKEKEVLKFSSRETAYQCYRQIKKEIDEGL